MPGMDGRDLLAILKADERLRAIPVVAFTTSAADTDVAASYHAHANAYVTKPLTADEFTNAVTHIHSFLRRPGGPRPRRTAGDLAAAQ